MSALTENNSSQEGLPPFWVGMAILIFFPLGFYLLWHHPTLRHKKAWWAIGIGWALFCIVTRVISPAGPENTTITESTPPALAEESSVEEAPVRRSFWGPTQLSYKKLVDLCDNPDKYKNTELKTEVKYNGGGIRQGGRLVSMKCVVFYSDGSFDMAFTIPKDAPQPRIEPGQYLWVTFVFSGDVHTPSRVIAITRK
jgi:hypothetical protein